MFSCNIKGKENPKDPQLVKLEMIFFKTGYARVPKVLSITGPKTGIMKPRASHPNRQRPWKKTSVCSISKQSI